MVHRGGDLFRGESNVNNQKYALEALEALLDEIWRHIGKRNIKKHYHLLVREEAIRTAIAKMVKT